MRRRRTSGPRLRFGLGCALALVLLAALPPGSQALSISGLKNNLVEFLLKKVSVPGQFEIQADRIEDAAEGGTVLNGVRILDGEGVWFTAARFSFSWSPAKLLKGDVQIDQLLLEGGRLARLPSPAPEPAAAAESDSPTAEPRAGWPRSPIAVRLGKLVVRDMVVADPVVPGGIAFDADGSLVDEGDQQSLTLAIVRTDQVQGAIDLTYLKRFEQPELALKLTAKESPGGLVARFTGLPDDVPASLELEAAGPPSAWAGRLALAAAGMLQASGTVSAQWAERLAGRFDLEVVPGPRLAAPLRDAIGEQATLRLAVQENPAPAGSAEAAAVPVVRIEQARLEASALLAELTGWVARDGGDSALDLELVVDEAAAARLKSLLAPATFEHGRFEMQVRGALTAPSVIGTGRVRGLAAAGIDPVPAQLDFSVEPIAPDRIRLALDLAAPELLAKLSGWLARDGSDSDVALELVAGAAGAARLAPLLEPARFTEGRFEMKLGGPLAAPAIVGQGRLRGLAAAGFGAETAQLDFSTEPGEAQSLRLALDLEAVAPYGPSEDYRAVLGDTAAVRFRGVRADTQLTVESFRLETATLRASADGSVDLGAPPRPDLRYRIEAPDLAPLAALGGTRASGRLQASGRLHTVERDGEQVNRAEGVLAIEAAVVNDQALGQVRVSHLTDLGEVVAGNVKVTLRSSAFGDGLASARIEMSQSELTLSALKVDLLEIGASGALRIPRAGGAAVGEVTLEVRSLEPIGRLAGVPMGGSARGAARLARSGRGSANLELSLSEIAVADSGLGSAVLSASASALTTRSPVLKASLTSQDAYAPELVLSALRVAVDGALGALRMEAALEGRHREQPVTLSLRGDGDLASKTRTVRIAELELGYAGEQLRIAEPTVITAAGPEIRLGSLDLHFPDEGRLAGSAALNERRIEAELALSALPIRLANLFAPTGISAGVLSGRVQVNTGADAPRLDADLEVSGLRLAAVAQEIAALRGRLEATWDGKLALAKLAIDGPFEEPLRAEVTLPLAPSPAGPVPVFPAGAPLQARLGWRGEVEPVFALLPLPDHLLQGRAAVEATAQGSIDGLKVSGEVLFSEGRYENIASGTILQDVNLVSRFSEARTIEFTLTGSDGLNGAVEIKGRIAELGAEPKLDVAVKVDDALLVRLDAATAEASVNLSATGTPSDILVKGGVVVQRAEIRLLNPTPPSIVDLGAVRIKGEPQEDQPIQRKLPSPIRLDSTVDLPGRVFVGGRGLTSEWGGSLAVTGPADQPAVRGRIEARRGQLDFIGRTFELIKGLIVFDGGQRINPTVDLRLEREANDLKGRILVGGNASAPTLSFASTPAVPEDEVLSRVLFGRSKQSLSAPEAIQLAAGVAALTSGKASVVDQARAALGVDVLRIESADTEEGESAVSVGRYVREGVYVGAKQSLDGKAGSVVVEIEVLDNIVLDADVGQGADSSVGVSWRKDF